MKIEGIYRNNWSNLEEMCADFQIGPPEGINVLFADYSYEDYSGSAFVLFEKDGELFEVNGGHCSCYGLEGQWEPSRTNIKAIRMREIDTVLDKVLTALEESGLLK